MVTAETQAQDGQRAHPFQPSDHGFEEKIAVASPQADGDRPGTGGGCGVGFGGRQPSLRGFGTSWVFVTLVGVDDLEHERMAQRVVRRLK